MKWFKHDSCANRDDKLGKVLLKYGADGYALYWLCLELIADRLDKDTADFELHHDSELLGSILRIDTLRVEEIMKYFLSLKLFEMNGDIVTCMKLAYRIERSVVKNPHIKQVVDALKSRTIPDNPGQSGTTRARLDKIRLEENREDIQESDAIKLIKTIHRQHSSEAHWDDEQYKSNTNWPLAMKRVKERLADGCDLEWFRWYLLAASRDKFCRDDLRFSLDKLLAPKMLDRLAIAAQTLRDAEAEEKTAAERESEEFTARLNALRAEAAREKE